MRLIRMYKHRIEPKTKILVGVYSDTEEIILRGRTCKNISLKLGSRDRFVREPMKNREVV